MTALVRFLSPSQQKPVHNDAGPLRVDDEVVVETNYGLRVGKVVAPEIGAPAADGRVVRQVSSEDRDLRTRLAVREAEGLAFARERALALGLRLRLVSCEAPLASASGRLLLFFSSPERVDFRQLVRDLAQRFHCRIDMLQLGVRDAASLTVGMGVCGRQTCCGTWLPGFASVTIRTAKTQNLALQPDKLSGLCGRLRCCLQYEQGQYEEARQGLPKLGKLVRTPQGTARVVDLDILRRRVRVAREDGGYAELSADEVSPLS